MSFLFNIFTSSQNQDEGSSSDSDHSDVSKSENSSGLTQDGSRDLAQGVEDMKHVGQISEFDYYSPKNHPRQGYNTKPVQEQFDYRSQHKPVQEQFDYRSQHKPIQEQLDTEGHVPRYSQRKRQTRNKDHSPPKKRMLVRNVTSNIEKTLSSQTEEIESEKDIDKICAFCKQGSKYSQLLGPYSKVGSSRHVYIHEICGKWAPDLVEYSTNLLYPPPRKFNVSLFKAIARSSSIKCAFCKKKGAAIGCVESKCRNSYHIHCAFKDKAMFLKVENLLQKNKIISIMRAMYCRDCNPIQSTLASSPTKPINMNEYIIEKKLLLGEIKELTATFLMVKDITGKRSYRGKNQSEITFLGNEETHWVDTDDIPSDIIGDEPSKSLPSTDAEESEQDDDVCDICKKADSPVKNPIVYCDGEGCEVQVHKNCYAIRKIPKADWLCNRCAANAPPTIACSKCSSTKPSGAMTCKFGVWTHINCLDENLKMQFLRGKSYSNVQTRRSSMARLTARDRNDIWEIIFRSETVAKCPICRINVIKKEGSFQCAHVDAHAKGCGETAQDEIWNMLPSCAKCNLTCNTKNLLDFMDSSIMMRPHIKPLLFLKTKSIIRSKIHTAPMSTEDIIKSGSLKNVIQGIYNPKNMGSLSRLLDLSSQEHHNLFVNYEDQAPEYFYSKFLK